MRTKRARQSGSIRTVVLPLACFLAGITLSAVWFSRNTPHPSAVLSGPPALSDSTQESRPTRAMVRPANAAQLARQTAPADPASRDAVRRAIPNLDSVSLEQGTQVLRAAALEEFWKAAQEMEAQVDKARQDFIQAQNSQSDARQQAALKRLQQIQAEQTDKLKQIAINSQAQIAALQQIKEGSH